MPIKIGEESPIDIRIGEEKVIAIFQQEQRVYHPPGAILLSGDANPSGYGALLLSGDANPTGYGLLIKSGEDGSGPPPEWLAVAASISSALASLNVGRPATAIAASISSASGELQVGDIVEYSFTMTPGNIGETYYGYDTGVFIGEIGSIDAEPVSGETLALCFGYPGSIAYVAFAGDITALLTGKSVWIDGVDYGFGVDIIDTETPATDWAYVSDVNLTVLIWSSSAPLLPDFSGAGPYFIEIK